MKMLKKKDGFTLVELIVVIAILAILAGVAIPAYSGYIKKANETADITALSAIKTAAQAATATEGAVTEIVVDVDASDKVSTITVKYADNATGLNVIPTTDDTTTTIDNDFKTFWGVTSSENYPTLKSETFKDGAKWTAADGWVKKQ